MRQVTETVCRAFVNRESKILSNTESTGNRLYLHGNLIAQRDEETGQVFGTLAGWPTPTTRERLNGLARLLGSNVHMYQKNHEARICTFAGEDLEQDIYALYRLS